MHDVRAGWCRVGWVSGNRVGPSALPRIVLGFSTQRRNGSGNRLKTPGLSEFRPLSQRPPRRLRRTPRVAPWCSRYFSSPPDPFRPPKYREPRPSPRERHGNTKTDYLLARDALREGGDSLDSCQVGDGDYRCRVRGRDMDCTKPPPAICDAEHASPRKPLNSKRMTKQQLIEKVAAKTE